LDRVLRRRRWIIHRRLEGWKIKDIAAALRISEKTVDRWWSVYRKDRWEGLRVKSRRPHRYYKTPQSTVNLILELRRSKHWGPNKIEGYLRNYRSEGITPVSHETIHRILVEAGLNNPITSPRRVWGNRRFQREHSNSLWQCDLKVVDPRWLITILDDHSRFVPGSERFNEGTAENVIWLLDRAVHEYSKPREILTDHGSQFWSVRGGESSFDAYCQQHGIKHILGGIGKPTTLGKIERWFRTYDLEHARFQFHRKFVEYYNWERPHMALDYSTPAEVYFSDVPHVLG